MSEKLEHSFKSFINSITGFADKVKDNVNGDGQPNSVDKDVSVSDALIKDFSRTYHILESLSSKTPTQVQTWTELVNAANKEGAFILITTDIHASSSLNGAKDVTILNDYVLDLNDYGFVDCTITFKGRGVLKSRTNKHAMFSRGSYVFKDIEVMFSGSYPMFYDAKLSINDSKVSNNGDAPMFYEVIRADIHGGTLTNSGRIMFYSGGYIFNDTKVIHNSADSMFNSITAEFNGGEYINNNSSAPMFYGTFSFNSGAFTNKSLYSPMFDGSHNADEVSIFNGGEFTNYALNMFSSKNNIFNGGKFVNHGSQFMFVAPQVFNNGEFINYGTAHMFAGEGSEFNGGTYINEGTSFMFIGNGSIFNDGTFINNGEGIMLSNGDFTINGGTFTNNGDDVIFDNTNLHLYGGKIVNYGETGIFHRGQTHLYGTTEIINDGSGYVFFNDVDITVSESSSGLIFYQEETLDDESCEWTIAENTKTIFKVIIDNNKWVDLTNQISKLEGHLHLANKTIDKKEDRIETLLDELHCANGSIEQLNTKLLKQDKDIDRYNTRVSALEAQIQVKPMIALEFDTTLGASHIPVGQIMETVYIWNGRYEDHVIDVLTLQNPSLVLNDISYETNLTEVLGEGWFTAVYASPFTSTYMDCDNEGLVGVPKFDIADLGVTSLSKMFTNAVNFNENISHWDTSTVMNMSYKFENAVSFNQDISKWNVDRVTNWTGFGDEAPHLIDHPEFVPQRFKGLILSKPNTNSYKA